MQKSRVVPPPWKLKLGNAESTLTTGLQPQLTHSYSDLMISG